MVIRRVPPVVAQQAAAQHGRLIEAIPERFRQGLRATFEKAEVYRSGS
jgi:hypothetical protein